MATQNLAADGTRDGQLPPFEVAKAIAFRKVLGDAAAMMHTSAAKVVVQRVDQHIASKLRLKGGGHPSAR